LRGNIDTRLRRVGEFDAVIVAVAALHRLGVVPDAAVHPLPADDFVPQVGQGALAVEVRRDDHAIRRLVATIDDPATRAAVTAERSFLAVLGGDCDLPAGAHAVELADGTVQIDAVLADATGSLHRTSTRSADATVAGTTAALLLQDREGLSDAG
jgi:hydroxymethylbilane synthase